jgi:hypothetical protein
MNLSGMLRMVRGSFFAMRPLKEHIFMKGFVHSGAEAETMSARLVAVRGKYMLKTVQES